MKTIEITISPTGESTLVTKGFAGANCQEATRRLELALGAGRTEQLTSEYFQTQRHDERQLERS